MGHADSQDQSRALNRMPSLYQLKGGVLVALEGDSGHSSPHGDIIDQGT